jgi:Co/Zn/Cd efflux system component
MRLVHVTRVWWWKRYWGDFIVGMIIAAFAWAALVFTVMILTNSNAVKDDHQQQQIQELQLRVDSLSLQLNEIRTTP